MGRIELQLIVTLWLAASRMNSALTPLFSGLRQSNRELVRQVIPLLLRLSPQLKNTASCTDTEKRKEEMMKCMKERTQRECGKYFRLFKKSKIYNPSPTTKKQNKQHIQVYFKLLHLKHLVSLIKCNTSWINIQYNNQPNITKHTQLIYR